MSDRPAPEECAICGAAIPPRAQACPECGADERTGWREQSLYDGIDLPDPEDDSRGNAAMQAGLSWKWKITGVVLIGLAVMWAVRGW